MLPGVGRSSGLNPLVSEKKPFNFFMNFHELPGRTEELAKKYGTRSKAPGQPVRATQRACIIPLAKWPDTGTENSPP
jgi:hypothetical protein